MERRDRRDLAIVLAVAWAVRLAFILAVPSSPSSSDAGAWLRVWHLLARGEDPYGATSFLSWPPLWMQIVYLIGRTSVLTGIAFARVLQLVLIGVESLLIIATQRLARALAPRARLRTTLLLGLSLNPVLILLTCQHANFDVLVALWVVLALLALGRFGRTSDPMDWLLGCLFLGLGVLTKSVPLVLVPLLFRGARSLPLRARGLGAALVAGPAALGLSVIYVENPAAVAAHVLAYRSAPGWFGISGILTMLHLPVLEEVYAALFGPLLLGVLVFVAAGLYKRWTVDDAALVLVATALLASLPLLGPGYGPQYVMWFLPLVVASYACYQAPWRRIVLGCYGVAVLTFAAEYAFLPSHGMVLVRLFPHAELLARWSGLIASRSAQTVMRLPWFVALTVLTAAATALVVRGVRSVPSRGDGGQLPLPGATRSRSS